MFLRRSFGLDIECSSTLFTNNVREHCSSWSGPSFRDFYGFSPSHLASSGLVSYNRPRQFISTFFPSNPVIVLRITYAVEATQITLGTQTGRFQIPVDSTITQLMLPVRCHGDPQCTGPRPCSCFLTVCFSARSSGPHGLRNTVTSDMNLSVWWSAIRIGSNWLRI
jgi:hypothetical protein